MILRVNGWTLFLLKFNNQISNNLFVVAILAFSFWNMCKCKTSILYKN